MRTLCLGLLFFAMQGCMTIKVFNSKVDPGEVKTYRRSHYMGGFGLSVIPVDCPNGIHSIAEGRTFGDSMLNSLTLGIWNPSTARVTCAK